MSNKPAQQKRTPYLFVILGAAALLASGGAQAHAGHDSISGFVAGFAHPLTGLDHLAAMLAVGLWSALAFADKTRAWRAPLQFAALMLAGAVTAMQLGWTLPGFELGITLSLMVLGLLLAGRTPLATVTGLALIAAFALSHGAAHGAELQGGWALAGMLAATLALHGAGLAIGTRLRGLSARWSQALGAGLVLFGIARLTGVAA